MLRYSVEMTTDGETFPGCFDLSLENAERLRDHLQAQADFRFIRYHVAPASKRKATHAGPQPPLSARSASV